MLPALLMPHNACKRDSVQKLCRGKAKHSGLLQTPCVCKGSSPEGCFKGKLGTRALCYSELLAKSKAASD